MTQRRIDQPTIIVDTREQMPFEFPDHDTVIQGLPTGDYSLVGFDDRVCVERKRPGELYLNFGRERERFRAEWERMAEMDYAAVVIEGGLTQIVLNKVGLVKPATVINSLFSWSVRFGVHVWPCPSRAFAQRATLRILEKFYEQQWR